MRYLKIAEIKEIINGLPRIKGSNINSVEKVQKSILNTLFMDLRQHQVPDNIDDKYIQELKKIIHDAFIDSQAIPGTPVGTITAETIGAGATQDALDTFHKAGTAEGSVTGLDQTIDLMNVVTSKDRVGQYNTVHFLDTNLTFIEILKKRKDFIEVNMKDLVLKIELRPTDLISTKIYYDTFIELNPDLDINLDIENCPLTVVVTLDSFKMYQHEILTYDIAHQFSFKKDSFSGIYCFPYIYRDNFQLHIIPSVSNLRMINIGLDSIDDISLVNIFIQNFLIPQFPDIVVKGMKGNTSIEPIKIDLKSLIKSVTPFRYDEIPTTNMLEVRMDRSLNRRSGSNWHRLVEFFEYLGYEIVYNFETPDQNEPDVTAEIEQLPDPDNVYVLRFNNPEMANLDSVYKSFSDKPDFSFKTQYFYAKILGNNLKEILIHPEVDNRRTISNNIVQVQNTFGIGAARILLLQEYETMFAKNADARWIQNIVNLQTSLGVVLPIGPKGISRQPIGPLVKASFDRATENFLIGSALGSVEKTNSVSTSIYLGERVSLGSGSIKLKRLEHDFTPYKQPVYQRKSGIILTSVSEGATIDDGNREAAKIRVGIPPNFPPPDVITSSLDLPPILIDFVEIGFNERIRSVLRKCQTNYDLENYLEDF